MEEKIFVNGRDSVIANILLIIALILFGIPILVVFLLRFLYKAIVSINSIDEKFVIHEVNISAERVTNED